MFGLPAVVGAVHGNSRDFPRAVELAGDLDAQARVARGRRGQTPSASASQNRSVGVEAASGAAGSSLTSTPAWITASALPERGRWRGEELEEGDRFVPRPRGVARRYFFAASK